MDCIQNNPKIGPWNRFRGSAGFVHSPYDKFLDQEVLKEIRPVAVFPWFGVAAMPIYPLLLVASVKIEGPCGYDAFEEKGKGFCVCEASAEYRPRNPEDNPLYGVVSRHLETYLVRQSEREHPVPRFVERELRAFLDCGVLANGFLRVHCDACGKDRVVAFSCKGRSVCSSCCGRRMADTAAHLVDRVLPEVPVRQWVLSLPFALRYRLAYDSGLVRDVLHIFIQAVFSSLRRRAGKRAGIRKARCGAVTFVQRFGGAINLNIHLHSLVPDGVFYKDGEQGVRFLRLPPPLDCEVACITERIARRVIRLLERRGLSPEADTGEADMFSMEQPLLAELYTASLQGRISTGPQAGNYLQTAGSQPEQVKSKGKRGSRCSNVSGFNLHANVCIPAKAPAFAKATAGRRHQLENLCRYVARPAVATERLSVLPDGRVSYRLRHKWRNGATHVLFEPLDLIAKLAALVPPPRFNLVRYHGIFAPASSWRSQVVPFVPGSNEEKERAGKDDRKINCCHPRNYSWSELLRRVFEWDVLRCPECGNRMRILCAINPPDAIRKILDCLGLPSRPPPISPAVEEFLFDF